jgi:hypothetical protein
MSRAVVLLLAVTSIMVSCWDSARAAPLSDQEVVRKILADFQARQRYVKAIRYSAIGTFTVAQGVHTGEPGGPDDAISPPQDVTCEVRRNWVLDFERGLIRKESWDPIWSPMKQRFLFGYQVAMLDGSRVRLYRPRELNATIEDPLHEDTRELLVYPKEQANRLWDISDIALQYAHGLTTLDATWDTGLRGAPDESLFRVVVKTHPREGSGFGGAVVRLHQPPDRGFPFTTDWCVDLDRDSAVVQVREYSGEVLRGSLELEYQKTAAGWLPQEWTSTILDGSGGLICSSSMEVVDYSIDPVLDLSEFTFTPRVGSVVLDTDGRDYRVASDGTLRLLRPSGGQGPGYEDSSADSYRLWLLVSSLTLLALLGIAIWTRSQKLRSFSKKSDGNVSDCSGQSANDSSESRLF